MTVANCMGFHGYGIVDSSCPRNQKGDNSQNPRAQASCQVLPGLWKTDASAVPVPTPPWPVLPRTARTMAAHFALDSHVQLSSHSLGLASCSIFPSSEQFSGPFSFLIPSKTLNVEQEVFPLYRWES